MNDLMARNEIVSVISEYTHLAPKGGRMWGLCPFHPEKQASFTVSPDKQLFHCFSCKAGGSVIQFIMQAENLSYGEAVRFLAQRAGMELPNEVDDAKLRAEKAFRDRLYQANREAARFFHKTLLSEQGLPARQYLLRRGIDGSTAVRFGLGYSPNDWDALFKYMTELGFSRDELIAAGLCIKGRQDEKKTFDFFHGRLMVPIISASGTVLAFGGRIIEGDDGAKYMNTGDTPIYNKRHNVYAINMMKGKKLDELIMVEGYMDVISLHQHGVDNAVASLGTALTSQQVRLMSRFAKRVVYAYDGDAAGQNAMLRGVDILKEGGVDARVLIIPGGDDPDEYIRKYGRDAFLKLRDSAITAVQFKIESMAKAQDLGTADGRQTFAKNACSLLASLDPVERDRYVRLVSERSGIGVDVIRQQCGVAKPAPSVGSRDRVLAGAFRRPGDYEKRQRSEIMLLSCLMASRADAAAIVQLPGYSIKLFSLEGLADFAEKLQIVHSAGKEADLRLLISSIEGDSAEAVGSAAAGAEELVNPVDTARDCIAAILNEEREVRIRELSALIEAETDPKKRGELLREQMELVMKLRANN